MPRILIAGVPRSGKTTLSVELGLEHKLVSRHTDDLIPMGWSEASAEAALWIAQPGPWLIEGVSVPRALRKWLAFNPGAPADIVYWMPFHRVALNRGQRTMASGCITVWAEILPILRARGVNPIVIGAT